MGDLSVIGDADACYLVAVDVNDDGEQEVVQLAKFENERGRKIFEAVLADLHDKAWMYEELAR